MKGDALMARRRNTRATRAKTAATPRRRRLARRAPARRSRRARRAAAAAVLVVNMIPKSLSGEEHQDSEPTIAVNPANPQQIAASAFTPDPAEGPRAPIYVSIDGGNTWTLNSIVPSTVADGSATADITVAFGTASNTLYAGIIRYPFPADRTRLNILRTKDFQSAALMTVLVDRIGHGVDQPYVQATTVASGSAKGKDRIYVGDNDFNATGGRTATIDQSLDAAKTNPTFSSVRIESRTTSGQDGPSVRPAIHPDGTVYATFHAWRTFSNATGAGTADIVVVRDDAGGVGPAPFTSLVDRGRPSQQRRRLHGVQRRPGRAIRPTRPPIPRSRSDVVARTTPHQQCLEPRAGHQQRRQGRFAVPAAHGIRCCATMGHEI